MDVLDPTGTAMRIDPSKATFSKLKIGCFQPKALSTVVYYVLISPNHDDEVNVDLFNVSPKYLDHSPNSSGAEWGSQFFQETGFVPSSFPGSG